MLKKITGSILTIMLMTTMFLGAFGVVAPEPVHAATYTFTVTADAFRYSTSSQGYLEGCTVGSQSISCRTNGSYTFTFQVDSAPTSMKFRASDGAYGKTITVSSDVVTNGVKKKSVTVDSYYVEYSSTLTANHTHTWNNNSYSASSNKITATCQGSGTCDLTKPTLTLNATGKTYNGSVVTASLTKSSTWSSQGLPTPTINYNPANSKNVGTYTASAKVGNATATQQFTISPKTVGLTWGTSTFDYDGNSHVPTATASGLVSGDSCTVTVDGAQTVAGTYTATASSLSNSNYALPSANTKAFTINKKKLTLTGVTANDKVYDGTDAADLNTEDAALEGIVEGDDVSFEIDGTYTDGKAVGNGKTITATATLSGEDANNYEVTPVTLEADITPKTVTVTEGITAQDKTYDGNTDATVDASGAVLDGKVDGDELGASASGAFGDKNAAEGKTVTLSDLVLSGADASNYVLAESGNQATTIASITAKSLKVSGITAENKEYDGKTDASINTDGASYDGKVDDDVVEVDIASADFENKNVGTDKTVTVTFNLSGKDKDNYTATLDGEVKGDITPKSVKVGGITVDDRQYDKTTDAPLNTSNATFKGIESGDELTVSGTGTFTDNENVGQDKPVSIIGLTLGGSDKDNYTVSADSQSEATGTITQREVTVSGITAQDKTYDGNTNATLKFDGLALNGKIDGDDLDVDRDKIKGVFEDKKAGVDKTVNISGYELTGSDAGNYKLAAEGQQTETKANIGQLEIVVSNIKAEDKTYDGNTDAELDYKDAVLTGKLDDDEVTVSAKGSFSDKNVGEGKNVAITDLKLEGDDAGNYVLASEGQQESATASITKRPVKVSGITADDKVYDGNTTATVKTGDAKFENIVSGDTLTVRTTGTFGDKNVGEGKTVTIGNLILGGESVNNYELASTGQQSTTEADITPKQVNVKAKAATKVYGDDDPAFEYTADSLLDDDKYTGSLSREAGEDVGTYEIQQGTLSAGDNYEINYTPADFTITQADNSVTASIEGWTYGDEPNDPSAKANFGEKTATFTYSNAADGEYTDTVPTNAGTWYVKATIAETDNYKGAVSDPVKFEIAKKVVELKWSDTELVYNGTPQKPKATATGLKEGDNCEVTVTGEQTDANAKTETENYKAEATELSNPNYKLPENVTKDFTIAQAEITVRGIAADNKTYDGNTNATLNYDDVVLDGKIGNEDVSVTATGTFDNKNAGKDKTVTISELALAGADIDNYVLAKDQQEDTTATINKKPITVRAEEKSKYYGSDDPELTYTVEPALIDGDNFTGALTRTEGEDVGDYVVSHGSLTAGDNYAMHYVPATFEILQASNSVTAAIEGWTYGEEANEPTATAKFGADTATFTYSDAADGDYSATVPTEAGTWYVKATVPETDNYKGAVSEPVEFEIEKKTIDLEWSDTALTYNGKAQKPKATAIGLVGDDECEVIVGGEQTDSNIKTVTDCYIATATGLDNGNYKLPDEVTCEFTIAPKDLTQAMLSLDSDVIESDGTEQGPEVTLTDEDIKDDDDNPKQLIEDDDYSLSGDVKTSKLGTHVVAVEGKGNYTGTLETSWVLVKEKSNADTEKGVDGAGDIKIFVSIENNTEHITVDNFTMDFVKSLLTEEELARRDAGEDITIYVETIEESSSDAPLLDRTELQALFKLKSAKDIRWFDIKVWKKIGNDAAISIHELKSELMMSINVPDEHKNAPEGYTRTFYFGTAHNGSARIIEETADTAIVFGSKEFSTYALAYKDTKIPEPDPDKPDNPDDSDTGDNGNGSSSSKGGAKTGDSNDIAGLMTLMLASACALGVAGYRRRKETDK